MAFTQVQLQRSRFDHVYDTLTMVMCTFLPIDPIVGATVEPSETLIRGAHIDPSADPSFLHGLGSTTGTKGGGDSDNIWRDSARHTRRHNQHKRSTRNHPKNPRRQLLRYPSRKDYIRRLAHEGVNQETELFHSDRIHATQNGQHDHIRWLVGRLNPQLSTIRSLLQNQAMP